MNVISSENVLQTTYLGQQVILPKRGIYRVDVGVSDKSERWSRVLLNRLPPSKKH